MAANVERARNLKKSELGGVIFGCKNSTMGECLSRQLFGLPAPHFLYVQNVEPGLPLFLFNYDERKLHGIFEAASSGKMNIDLNAWTSGGSHKTNFPAQVQIRVLLECQPLVERQFKPMIADNYYKKKHFKFELDHAQASKLMSLFSSSERQFKPMIADNYYKKKHFKFELDHAQASKLMSLFSSSAVGPRLLIPKSPTNKRAVVVERSPSKGNTEDSRPCEPLDLTSDVANVNDYIGTSAVPDDSQPFDRGQLKEGSPSYQKNQMTQPDEDLVCMKLISHENSDANIMEHIVEAASTDGSDLLLQNHRNAIMTSGKGQDESSPNSFDYPVILSQVLGEIEELKAFKQEHTLKMASLAEGLVEAKKQISRLEDRCMILESISNPSATVANDGSRVEPLEFNLNLDQSIFLLGGFDGVSWLSTLDSFSLSHDVLRSNKPMSCIRKYASVAEFDGEIYVLGGESGSMWCDIVESYNPLNNHWTPRPSLNRKKGSLAAAALDGKLFAVGGGNGFECFSGVEMFDPNAGMWISACLMHEKRFSFGAVEYRGALYAVGGYDGNNYLNSAERFDPRENSWRRICSMDTKRGCHSLVVLNEKLYAIGGYDGTSMVQSVEIYDPRLGTWMAGEPINEARGYSAAAVVNESIFLIGGVDTGDGISDLIECYKEGQGGWEATNLRALGKRCFASAIVLGKN